jgi:hypothetical protein
VGTSLKSGRESRGFVRYTAQLQKTPHNIGVLKEKSLHSALKEWYAQPGDQFEVSVDGFVVDIVRGGLLVEIQTRNFGALKPKLAELVVRHPVRLVYPIAAEKWVVKLAEDGVNQLSRRKSPKRGVFEHVFEELVSFPKLLLNPNFSIELLLIQEEEVRRYEGTSGWRRKGWVTHERRLLRVVEQRILETPMDMCAFIPSALAEPFTSSDLAIAIAKPRRLAQKMVYCLRLTSCITPMGKRGNAISYTRTPGCLLEERNLRCTDVDGVPCPNHVGELGAC